MLCSDCDSRPLPAHGPCGSQFKIYTASGTGCAVRTPPAHEAAVRCWHSRHAHADTALTSRRLAAPEAADTGAAVHPPRGCDSRPDDGLPPGTPAPRTTRAPPRSTPGLRDTATSPPWP